MILIIHVIKDKMIDIANFSLLDEDMPHSIPMVYIFYSLFPVYSTL